LVDCLFHPGDPEVRHDADGAVGQRHGCSKITCSVPLKTDADQPVPSSAVAAWGKAKAAAVDCGELSRSELASFEQRRGNRAAG